MRQLQPMQPMSGRLQQPRRLLLLLPHARLRPLLQLHLGHLTLCRLLLLLHERHRPLLQLRLGHLMLCRLHLLPHARHRPLLQLRLGHL